MPGRRFLKQKLNDSPALSKRRGTHGRIPSRRVGHAQHAHRKGCAHPELRRRCVRPANKRRYLGLRPARPLGLRLTTNLLRLTTNLHAIIHHARNFKELYKNFDFLFSYWLGELKIHTTKDCMLYSDT